MIRELQRNVAPRAARFLTRQLRGLAKRSTAVHPDLDPELRVVLGLAELNGNGAGLVDAPVPKARKKMARGTELITLAPRPVAQVKDLTIDGAEGPLPARHYTSVPHARNRPLLVYLHGGGFCLGDLDTHDQPCRLLCAEGGFDVLSVAYRLAPEHPFPAAMDDVRAALHWARAHAESLGVEPERIGMGGDSAGATLTTVVSHLERDAGQPGPCLQMLIYPGADRTQPTESQERYGQGLVLTREDIDTFTRHYVNGAADMLDLRVSPLRAPSQAGLPPAVVATAGCDPLRDEGDAYARAMQNAGVQVQHLQMAGMPHGFIHMLDVSQVAERNLRKVARTTAQLFAKVARELPREAQAGVGA